MRLPCPPLALRGLVLSQRDKTHRSGAAVPAANRPLAAPAGGSSAGTAKGPRQAGRLPHSVWSPRDRCHLTRPDTRSSPSDSQNWPANVQNRTPGGHLETAIVRAPASMMHIRLRCARTRTTNLQNQTAVVQNRMTVLQIPKASARTRKAIVRVPAHLWDIGVLLSANRPGDGQKHRAAPSHWGHSRACD